jgi:FKBP-type peptidyl-prolyl cis-trans isomerase 2
MEINNLKKVSLAVTVDPLEGQPEFSFDAHPFTFIYGVASDGLSPLECSLAGKRVGESVHFELPRSHARELCGHLLSPLKMALTIDSFPERMNIEMAVKAVEVANDAEVVQAMTLAQNGCGGDCGCGCG